MQHVGDAQRGLPASRVRLRRPAPRRPVLSAPGAPRDALSAAQARRLALSAQGFGAGQAREQRGGDGWSGALLPTIRRLGLLQIDSVNVLTRAHLLPLFSRLGPYDRDALDRMSSSSPRRLFEYWAHAACLLPVTTQPLLRWRMDRAREEAWGGMRRVESEHPGVLARVLTAVDQTGPATAGEIELVAAGGRTARSGEQWGWNWSDTKQGLEMLFWAGEVTTAGRRGFERLYDLPQRALPADVLDTPTPEPADARRELTRIAARALGVATEPQLRDYFRLGVDESRTAVAELVESGDLLPVTVQGWRRPALLDAGATVPRRVRARALLVPFDPLVFERGRVAEVFGMDYRIEIYVPQDRRVHGYYVLPFLLGDALVARVDLKADRQAGVLRVRSAHAEPGAPSDTAGHLAAELALLAGWLGVPEVVVEPRGDLAAALAAEV